MKTLNCIAMNGDVNASEGSAALDHQEMAVTTAFDLGLKLDGDLLNQAATQCFQKTLPRPTELQTVNQYEAFKARAMSEFSRGLNARGLHARNTVDRLDDASVNVQSALNLLSGIEFAVSAAEGPEQFDQLAALLDALLPTLRIKLEETVESITTATARG